MTTGRYGALSDRWGRRPIIFTALLGTIMHDLVVILVAKYWRTLGLEFFLVGAILDGLSGSFTTTMAATNAYITDCTTPDHRAVSFAYMQSVFFGGFAFGPLLGGVVISSTGSVIALFCCALIAHLAIAIAILLLIPESVTPEHKIEAKRLWNARRMSADGVLYTRRQWRYWVNILNVFQPLGVFWPRGSGTAFKRKRRNLVILGVVDGILLLNIGAMAVVLLYPIYMFNWGDLEVSTTPKPLKLIVERILPIYSGLRTSIHSYRGAPTHNPYRSRPVKYCTVNSQYWCRWFGSLAHPSLPTHRNGRVLVHVPRSQHKPILRLWSHHCSRWIRNPYSPCRAYEACCTAGSGPFTWGFEFIGIIE